MLEITGGELSAQAETIPLMPRSHYKRLQLLRPMARFPCNGCLRSRSRSCGYIKCRTIAGEGESFLPENLSFLQPHDELRIVLSGRDELLFAQDFLQTIPNLTQLIHFSVVWDRGSSPSFSHPVSFRRWSE